MIFSYSSSVLSSIKYMTGCKADANDSGVCISVCKNGQTRWYQIFCDKKKRKIKHADAEIRLVVLLERKKTVFPLLILFPL